jgi:Ca2+-binding EF-hand superfamily protein
VRATDSADGKHASNVHLQIDINGDGKIQKDELQHALHVVGVDLPGYKVRELMQKYGQRDYLSFSEFSQVRGAQLCTRTLKLQLYEELKRTLDIGHKWAKEVKQVTGVIELEGMTEASQAVGIKHSIRIEVRVCARLRVHDVCVCRSK